MKTLRDYLDHRFAQITNSATLVTVVEVGEDGCTCAALDNPKARYYNVRYRADFTDTPPDVRGLRCIPRKDSTAIMVRIGEGTKQDVYALLSVERPERWEIHLDANLYIDINAETNTVALKGPTITLNGDGAGGVVKVAELVAKLNQLETAVNNLITFINAHTHPTPAGPSSIPSAIFLGSVTQTTQAQIENPTVKHG